MSYSLLTSVATKSSTDDGLTTSAINTTSSTLLVAALAYFNGASAPISDSAGNTWTTLTPQVGNGGGCTLLIAYCANPATSSSHTFTIGGSANYASITVAAFTGSAASPFDQQNGSTGVGGTTLSTGSITPTINNELLIAGVSEGGVNGASFSIDSGFTVVSSGTNVGDAHSYGSALAYLVQSTAAASNPQWTVNGTAKLSTAIASFKPLTVSAVSAIINQPISM